MPADLSIFWARLLTAAILAVGTFNVWGAVPVNDRCANAIVVPANGPFPHITAAVDITSASRTNDPPLPSCQTELSRSVWYVFTPAATDVYRLSTCSDSGTTVRDTVMAIYTSVNGCGTTYTEVADGCSDDGCNKNSVITKRLTSGVRYHVVIWQYGSDAPAAGQGTVRLLVERGAPANDDCSNPQPVELDVPVLGRTIYAQNDYDFGNTLCFTGIGQTPVDTPGLDVVFSFTAPASDTYSFKVKNYNVWAEPDYDLVIYVSPVCPILKPGGTMNDCLGAANRNLSIAEEIICVPLTNSQRVYIFVDDRYDVNRGSSFTLEVTRCIPEIEPNTDLAAAQPYVFETTGGISPISETDFYALGRFTPGSRVFALIDAISANLPNFDLWVVSSTDTLEYDTDNNDVPYGQGSASVAGTPLPGDCAWLRVRHVPTISEPYRLYAVVQPPSSQAVAEIEPNALTAQAQSAPENYFSGRCAAMADEDLYAFDALAGDVIYLGLDADPLRDRTPFDAQLELLNAAGSILMAVDDPASTSSTNTVPGVLDAFRPYSPAESIICRAPYSGRYYARVSVSPFSLSDFQGDYLLSITRNGFTRAGATNTPPAVVGLATDDARANSPTPLTGTIIDPDPGAQFNVTINWGDGTPNTLLTLPVCEYSFQAPHEYSTAGSYTVTVIVRDLYGESTMTNTTVQVTGVTESARFKSIAYGSSGSVQLGLEGTPNSTYRIEVSPDLRNWSSVASRTADANGLFQFQDLPPLPPRRFYRAVSP